MATVSLFWNNNVAAVTSCENALLQDGSRYPLVSKVANSLFFIHSSIHLFSGGVDSCVKLWNAHAICNPDDEDDEANSEK